MGKLGVLGIETEAVAEYTCVAHFGGKLVGNDVAFLLNDLELVDTVELLFAVFLTVNNHLKTEVTADTVGIDNDFNVEGFAGDSVVELAAVAQFKHLDTIPCFGNVLFPVNNRLSQSIVVGAEAFAALCLFVVEAADVVFDHSLHGEVGSDVADRALDILDPAG